MGQTRYQKKKKKLLGTKKNKLLVKRKINQNLWSPFGFSFDPQVSICLVAYDQPHPPLVEIFDLSWWHLVESSALWGFRRFYGDLKGFDKALKVRYVFFFFSKGFCKCFVCFLQGSFNTNPAHPAVKVSFCR